MFFITKYYFIIGRIKNLLIDYNYIHYVFLCRYNIIRNFFIFIYFISVLYKIWKKL